MPAFTPVMPHGDLAEVFPGVFLVTGTSRPIHEGTQWQFSRNMTVVRDGADLTLINTIRLGDAGLAALDRLGTVRHVVKIGAFHGIDDAFYVDRYEARLWALPGVVHDSGLPTTDELTVDGPMPFTGCSLFQWSITKAREALLLIDRDGGILVACDSLQNWADVDSFFDDTTAVMMRQYGFIAPTNVGPAWRQFCEPQPADFARILALPFRHLLSAHGTPVVGDAHERYAATFKKLYDV